MGIVRHELVVIEGGDWTEELPAKMEALRQEMPVEFRHLLVGPVQAAANGYQFWALFPDGSKEFWGTSDEGKKWRAKFKALKPYSDSADVHIAWGDEPPEITNESWGNEDEEVALGGAFSTKVPMKEATPDTKPLDLVALRELANETKDLAFGAVVSRLLDCIEEQQEDLQRYTAAYAEAMNDQCGCLGYSEFLCYIDGKPVVPLSEVPK